LCIGLSVRGIERSADKLPDRCSHLAPMPKRDAKLFEVLIGQMAEDGNINIVFGKTLNVRGHAELFEPICNVLHGSHQRLVVAVPSFRPGSLYRYADKAGFRLEAVSQPRSHARTRSASTL
jgi:hypothetical protein